jgi:ribonuclease P protein component
MSSAAASPSQRFPRQSRLLRHADFQRVYQFGRKHFSGNITVFYLWRDSEKSRQQGQKLEDCPAPRVGITVGRALGTAVKRVRIKRRVRAAIRMHLSRVRVPADVVINPRKSVLTMGFSQLCDEVRRAFDVVSDKAKPASMRRQAPERNE